MAATQTRAAVKIGNLNSDRVDDISSRGCRTQQQYEGVMAHFRRHPSAWWTGNPFHDVEDRQYRCGFHLAYFDPQGRYCNVWVRASGAVEYSAGAPHEAFKTNADRTIAQYGMFRG